MLTYLEAQLHIIKTATARVSCFVGHLVSTRSSALLLCAAALSFARAACKGGDWSSSERTAHWELRSEGDSFTFLKNDCPDRKAFFDNCNIVKLLYVLFIRCKFTSHYKTLCFSSSPMAHGPFSVSISQCTNLTWDCNAAIAHHCFLLNKLY